MPAAEIYPLAIEIQVYSALLLKFFNQALEERLRARGEKVTSLQHGLLRMLQFEELTISVISQRMGLDPSTLVRAVDSLERKELVQRGVDPHDRRRNPIHLTQKGMELITSVPIISGEDLTFQAIQSLGVEPTRQLRDSLRTLIQQFPEGKIVADLMAGPLINSEGDA